MKRKHFSDPARFQEAVGEHLAEHEAENNLILGILANILAGDYKDIEPHMSMIEEDGIIQQVFLRTPPFPVLISYRKEPPSQGIVGLGVQGLQADYGDMIKGMTGDKEIVPHYAEAWSQRTGMEPELNTEMRIYKLEDVNPVEGVPGEMRLAAVEERDLLLKWFQAFHQEALGEEVEVERVEKGVEHYLHGDPRRRGLMFWEVEGRPVSMTGYSGPTPHGIRINAVYTPPELRRNGYASACVAALSQHLLDQVYRFCFLFTDLDNPTSNHIYQEIGYRAVSDVDKFLFHPQD
ncbi:MAG: GNAT family N-acetyltransferase [Anaerolineales bacterium]|nr:GNAT family N-acetyltransferase [Anaerolineales bacterium]